MNVTEQKTMDLIIYFATTVNIESRPILKVIMNGKEIECVKKFKLLGIIISQHLSWDAHVDYLFGKTTKCIQCFTYLNRY